MVEVVTAAEEEAVSDDRCSCDLDFFGCCRFEATSPPPAASNEEEEGADVVEADLFGNSLVVFGLPLLAVLLLRTLLPPPVTWLLLPLTSLVL